MNKIALCQICPELFDLEKNTNQVLAFIEKCSKDNVELVIFPELSLTGFNLQEKSRGMAEKIIKENRIKMIQNMSKKLSIDVIIGYPLLEKGKVYNAVVYIEGGKIKGIHRKIYLANYGHCSEDKYFDSGNKITVIESKIGRIALFISEDVWHMSSSLLAAQMGAQISVICSATSVLDKQKLYDVQFTWEMINIATALSQTMYVVYNNRYGIENELSFWGGSHIVNYGGNMLAKGKVFEEDILMTDLDLDELKKSRKELPLVENEKNQITYRYLNEIINNS